MELDERGWIRALAARLPTVGQRVEVGVGDDMAVLRWPADRLVVATDMLLDGVHFRLAEHGATAVGRKAANCCLSDCAAMAVHPVAALVSLALPRPAPAALAIDLLASIAAACAVFDCAVVGGDTTAWDGPLAIDVAITAEPVTAIAPVTRRGGKPGDRLFVTGRLGGSLQGRHLAFTPRITEALTLARSLGDTLHAMIDITDGLAIDADRLAEASGVAVVLDHDALAAVASDTARALTANGGAVLLDQVLHDGEDFELLVASSCPIEQAAGLGLVWVGEMRSGEGTWLRDPQGQETAVPPQGWQHF